MGECRMRLRTPGTGAAITVDLNQPPVSVPFTGVQVYPCKEWSLSDDVMNVADSASVTIANDDGQVSGKFTIGQRVELDESDSDVASGQWTRQFTGRITGIETYGDIQGGSNIMLSMMDLGWHLTSSAGKPLVNLRKLTFAQLIQVLIDPTWGFAPTASDNNLNRRLKQGRQAIAQAISPQFRAVLPFIQIEPGQTPWEILQLYAAREGALVNIGVQGGLVIFRPSYTDVPPYAIDYHASTDSKRSKNNVLGRPTLREQIDGLYSEYQVWSTIVVSPKIANTTNPNASYTKTIFRPATNPLPFERRKVVSDSEAITPTLRQNRATWNQQMGEFQSWSYECDLQGHSQNGSFIVSDTMMSVDDTVNLVSGSYYVQQVRRSQTLSGGTTTHITLRKPVLNPALTALGGGAQKAAKTKVQK